MNGVECSGEISLGRMVINLLDLPLLEFCAWLSRAVRSLCSNWEMLWFRVDRRLNSVRCLRTRSIQLSIFEG